MDDELDTIKRVFNGFCDMYNIDYTPKNESNFIETPGRIKNKKCAINPQNTDNKCFQYSIAISTHHKEIKNNPERISKSRPNINNFNWEKNFFFLSGFSSRPSMNHRTAGVGGGHFLTPDYHFHPLHRHSDISRVITAESSPLHIGSSWT